MLGSVPKAVCPKRPSPSSEIVWKERVARCGAWYGQRISLPPGRESPRLSNATDEILPSLSDTRMRRTGCVASAAVIVVERRQVRARDLVIASDSASPQYGGRGQ